jgi:hypothetical protein
MHLLHYLAKLVTENCPEARAFVDDLDVMEKAARSMYSLPPVFQRIGKANYLFLLVLNFHPYR